VDPATLSAAQLSEYQQLLGTVMSRTDWLMLRLSVLGQQSHAILAGVRDETQLTRYMVLHGNSVAVDASVPAPH
jgi:hypothetical protein